MAGIMSEVTLKLQIKTSKVTEKNIQSQLRKIMMAWSCFYDLSNGCDKWALQKFFNWKDDPAYLSKNIMLIELKSIIYCMGAKFYDEETAKYLYSFSKTQTITTGEALRLLRGVACTSKFMTFMEILNDIFDINNPTFSFLKLKEFVLSLKQSHFNSLLSFRYLKHFWKTIYERFHKSNGILNAIIEGATYFLRTKEQYNEVLTLRNSVPETDYSTLASLDQAIDQIVYNINWDIRNLKKFRKWLVFYNKTLI
ncbi:unnamed protein product [Nezara viridula]|uniref:ERAP1-like C-terminal domain-containing protein n=1 Tax=Nezara viridula TaxID=85310 RepID=A0A9P0HGN3_NEZVI|nr:unnamed protein product [Nezara viridula]